MSNPTRPLLITFIGFPGSGKTYFGTRIADKLNAVRINSDAMRLAIFGSLEEIGKVYHSPNRQNVNTYVFGAMDYLVRQVLETGVSVIYEAVQSKRSDRTSIEQLAEEVGAVSILVWVKTDKSVALHRGQYREATAENRQFNKEEMQEAIDQFDRALEPPEPSENLIEISGETDFDQQLASFTDHLQKYL